MSTALKSLGYREITLSQNTIIGKQGQTIRGHEFHYSALGQRPRNIQTVYSDGPGWRLEKSIQMADECSFAASVRATNE